MKVPGEIEIDRELGSRSLHEFIKLSWPIVEPDQPFYDSWHIGCLTEHYEACLHGEIHRLVVNIPPGTSKSRITDVFFPTYAWLNDPGLRFISASCDVGIPMRDAEASLKLIQSKWFKERWFDKFLVRDGAPIGEFKNQVGGWRFATSVEGRAIGRHADIQIIDDPYKPNEMTKTVIENVRRWMQNTMASRWRKPGLNCRILIMQRLHVDDLTQTMLEEGATHVCLPMQYNPKIICETKWGKDPRTEPGELLCPDRITLKDVELLRKEMGSIVAAAQLDQQPVPDGGAVFKLNWFKYWKVLPEKFDETIFSWDCTFKDLESSDFVVGQAWGRKGGEYWLIDQVKGKWAFTETCEHIRKLARKHSKIIRKLIEDKANGSAVIDHLQKEISGIQAVNPEGGKVARANAVQPLFESGNVYIPDPTVAEWVDNYTSELTAFPMGRNDDQVDATSQALIHLHKRRNYLKDAMKEVKNQLDGGERDG